MRRVRVAAGRTPYQVLIGPAALSHPDLRRFLGKRPAGVVITCARVMKHHGPMIRAALEMAGFEARRFLLLPDGEAAKTARVWERCVGTMAGAGLDRSSFVIAVGGGSVGDVAGFAAATYMRGIRLIQMPTTLLSMVDSSVGGKTGINLPLGKNLAGSFHQPGLVLADLAFLGTLPPRERQSGVYEVLKCGLLRSGSLLSLIERTRGLRTATSADLEEAIASAVRIKARIVERDERESGERVLLNLGHTLGHALEAATAYRRFTHGEAVGYGLEFAVDLSERLGLATGPSARRMRAAIRAVGRRAPLSASMAPMARSAARSDKKREGLGLKEILLARPGKPLIQLIDARELTGLMGAWILEKAEAHGRRGPSKA